MSPDFVREKGGLHAQEKGSVGKELAAVRHSLRALDRSLARLGGVLLAR